MHIPVYCAVGCADALEDDPAVPKECQGRNYTSLTRRLAQRPAQPAAPDERTSVRSLSRSNLRRGCPALLRQHCQPW